MADTIQVKFKVSEDGTLTQIGHQAEKAAASTDKATTAADKYKKGQKGVAQATSNSTKAFSKMTTGMQGGLVPAYAEIAARVFALTAAFGLLSRNDAIIKLQEGIEFTGRSAGRNLTLVSEKLVEITDNAISAEQAMRATAVGVSAGFSEDQLSGLAEVAKGASLALGRDMADAMDRLIRGAAKLEPEILDELGIMVRLDQAAEDYARTLNKNVNELTQFEKRMAFTNAIITQGSEKFGELGQSMEASAFSKLAASLSDISKSVIGSLNSLLGPVANFFASNTAALGALVALYAGSVAGTIVGGISAMSAASAQAAERTKTQADNSLKAIKPTKGLSNAFNVLAHNTDRSKVALTKMMKELTKTINHHNVGNKKLKQAKSMRQQLSREIFKQDLATAKLNFTNALNIMQEVGVTAAAKAHADTLKTLVADTVKATASQNVFFATLTVGQAVVTGVAASVKFLGAALLTMMPYIGMALAAFTLLYPIIEKVFGLQDNRLEAQAKKNAERFKEFDEVVQQFNATIGKSKDETSAWVKTLEPLSGLVGETASAIGDTIGAYNAMILGQQVDKTRELVDAEARLVDLRKRMAGGDLRVSNVDIEAQEIYIRRLEKQKEKLGEVSEEQKNLFRSELLNSMGQFDRAAEMIGARLEKLKQEGAPTSEALMLVETTLAKTAKIRQDFLRGDITEEGLRAQYDALSISLKGAFESYKKFNDLVNSAKDTVGSLTESWGKYAKGIDNTSTALKEIGAILDNADGISAANQKATDILAAYGITPKSGQDPVKLLKAFNQQLKDINSGYKQLAKDQAAADNYTGSLIGKLGMQGNAIQRNIELVEAELEIAVPGLEKENELLREQLALRGKLAKNLKDMTAAEKDRNVERRGKLGAEYAFAADTMIDDAMANPDAKLSDQIGAMMEATAGMREMMKDMGPDGPLVSSVITGAFVMTEAFVGAFEDIEAGGDKVQIGLEIASAAIAQTAAIMAADSKARIKAIDEQIAAEKKRDGKSEASVARLKALEKKKENIARKAFDTQKKLQMAQIITSTAVGIMKAMEFSPETFGLPWSGVIGAMGAASLALVASTSYQGGGGSAPAAPSKVAMGERQNSVDLAKGNNAAGELAYMRGSSGYGTGATNFKPAFSGYKHRAGGGYIVGEQGPEVFMPNTSGEIIPSGQDVGGTTNVNFSINAVDSAGVQDLLLNQRGNIIGMIREAANENGEFFLESIDPDQY